MDNEDVLFIANSPLQYSVFLTSSRYYEHIISPTEGHTPHAEFSPNEIKQTIENPLVIYEGTQPNTDVYFSKAVTTYPNLFLKVPVSTYPDGGEVVTAFLQKTISGGIKDGGIKYVSRGNKL